MKKLLKWLRLGALLTSLVLLTVLDGFIARQGFADEPGVKVQRQFDAAGRVLRDQQVDEQNRPHGLLREFYANGVVRYQAQFVEGRREGLEKNFREDASLSRLAYVDGQGRELASAALLADGRLGSLREQARTLRRWGVGRLVESEGDDPQPFHLQVRPAIVDIVGEQWLQRLDQHNRDDDTDVMEEEDDAAA